MGSRLQQLSQDPAIPNVAHSATSRKRTRNSRLFSYIESTQKGGPLLGIARPIWLKVTESERRIAWMCEMLRKKLIVKDIENFVNTLNEKLRTDSMRVKEEEREVALGLMKVKLMKGGI